MTQLNDNRIIAPPIEEEVYPYRRVWRSISIQATIMIILSTVVILLGEIFGLQFSQLLNSFLSLILAIVPVSLWLIFSVLPERFVAESRSDLLIIAIISGLTASAIGIPFTHDIFQVEQWLPLESALQRILGFAFTVGIVDSAIKFVVVRYFIFPHRLRIRADAVAYFVASAIGYSFVINLYALSEVQSTYSISMVYIFSNYVMQLVSGLFLAYGLSETYFNNAVSIVMPINILISSLIVGVISPLVTGLMNGPLATQGNADRPIFSIGFLIAILIAVSSVVFFLFNVAEQREREAFSSADS